MSTRVVLTRRDKYTTIEWPSGWEVYACDPDTKRQARTFVSDGQIIDLGEEFVWSFTAKMLARLLEGRR